jgi:hypothetical protein
MVGRKSALTVMCNCAKEEMMENDNSCTIAEALSRLLEAFYDKDVELVSLHINADIKRKSAQQPTTGASTPLPESADDIMQTN